MNTHRSTAKRLSVLGVVVAAFAAFLTLLTVVPAQASPVTVGLPSARSSLQYSWLTAKHHDYPAADIPLPSGSTGRAIIGGRVTQSGWNGACGYSVTTTATTADGRNLEVTYCHAKVAPTVRVGEVVRAFDPIIVVGSTGNSSGPHMHIQVKRNGTLVCPQQALVAAWNNQTYDFNNAPTTGCFY